ncbi:RodZ family helix-turn-helix domain-containing protein [Sporosarcina sp. Te-1]|uniref:helix-turn-helix domain-containing protein n=1 Tax=Sporosarcina sp. Te-1 TaxID=2818390 RepID=UPI001A9DD0AF|nr:RodZ domain-containing protein [Sporosarcina sp. Te-1]QTD42264.1 helix-turn-helix domain-containing protein [Sporosarcina sp. Te-1]
MTGLGDRLKEARTAKGYSLDDLQSLTKIQKRYLSGIENEDYSMMPGSFYVRAFIKQYAEAVGLDADEMLSLYKESAPAVKPEEESGQVTSPTMSRKRGFRTSNRFNEMAPKIIVALFIIVIIVVIWTLYQQRPDKPIEESGSETDITLDNNPESVPDTKPGKEDKPEKGNDSTSEVDGTENVEPPVDETVKQELAYTTTAGETSTYTLTNAEQFNLEIKTSGDSWIGVLDSAQKERTPKADVRKAGEVLDMDVSDTESVRIRVGRTFNTEIYVNGELLKYPSDRVTQNIIIEYKK